MKIAGWLAFALAIPLLAAPAPMTMVGGWKEVSPADPTVDAALVFVHENPKLVKIKRVIRVHKAWTQVVSGTKVRLLCSVQLLDGKTHTRWEMLLWHKADQTWEVTSSHEQAPT